MIKIGVISPADIAFRRFMPALMENKDFEFVGLAMYSREERFRNEDIPLKEQDRILDREKEKAEKFIQTYGGILFESYDALVSAPEVEAVYLPLPPALHYEYAQRVLISGKHLLVEKPATLSGMESHSLISSAREKGLALHENYMFVYHRQIEEIRKLVARRDIGDIRLLSMKFGFPKRAESDFRYKKSMGGGALFDACGYPVKLATALLGNNCSVSCACLNSLEGYEVDMYGSATLVNDKGQTAQLAFGMDNEYRCELEIWGSEGTFRTGRIFTAPSDMVTTGSIVHQGSERQIELGKDNAFANSLKRFYCCITDSAEREKAYQEVERQASLIEDIYEKGQWF